MSASVENQDVSQQRHRWETNRIESAYDVQKVRIVVTH